MKHAHAFAILSSVAFAACFGPGPVPSNPTDATVLFGVDPSISNGCVSHYIGDVAFDADHGYAIALPYSPSSCGGGSPPQEPLPVFQFSTAGGAASAIGSAGTSSGTAMFVQSPHVVATAHGPRWEYYAISAMTGSGSMPTVAVDGPQGRLVQVTSTGVGGTFGPAGIVSDASALYVATSFVFSTLLDSNAPDYLCCTNSNGMGGQSNTHDVRRYDLDGAGSGAGTFVVPANTVVDCASAHQCYATTAGSLFYFDGTQVMAAPTAGGGTPTHVTDLVGSPIGIATTAASVIVASTQNYLLPTSNPAAQCVIVAIDPASLTATTLLSTQQFSCMDVAADDTYAYFTIVTVTQSGDTNGGGNPPLAVHGDGIGRVPLAGGAIESIDLKFNGLRSGPRRVYLGADDIYAVDPQAIGKIAKSALSGRTDFPVD